MQLISYIHMYKLVDFVTKISDFLIFCFQKLLNERSKNGYTPLLSAVVANVKTVAIHLLRLAHALPSSLGFKADAVMAEEKIYDQEIKQRWFEFIY